VFLLDDIAWLHVRLVKSRRRRARGSATWKVETMASSILLKICEQRRKDVEEAKAKVRSAVCFPVLLTNISLTEWVVVSRCP
jgi:hypothetical protein